MVEVERADEVAALREKVEQLETALRTRVVIEQAKGILAERFELPIADAFALLRYSARSSSTSIHRLAQAVVESAQTPPAILIGLARQQRWRAAQCARTAGERDPVLRVAERIRRGRDQPGGLKSRY